MAQVAVVPGRPAPRDAARFYPINGTLLPSVTTILEVIAKPALGPWYAKEERRYFESAMLEVLTQPGARDPEYVLTAVVATVKDDALIESLDRLPTRAKPMRRTSLRRKTPLGRAARHRIAEGGARATGRRAASLTEWRAIRARVFERAGWECQACGAWRRLDVHHIIKRSRGGSDVDLDQLVALCQACHERTDAPYAVGRLIILAFGAGQFAFEVIRRASK